jgi:hypothetical protein
MKNGLVSCLLLALCGCDLLPFEECDAMVLPALRVTLVDSSTRMLLAPSGVLVVATAGSYADTVHFADDSNDPPQWPADLAFEHAGAYRITAAAPGYRRWEQGGFVVRRGKCHVRGIDVTALMQHGSEGRRILLRRLRCPWVAGPPPQSRSRPWSAGRARPPASRPPVGAACKPNRVHRAAYREIKLRQRLCRCPRTARASPVAPMLHQLALPRTVAALNYAYLRQKSSCA